MSTEYFVTMCDYRFLPQLLCLYRSLKKLDLVFELNVVCFCEPSFNILKKIGLENLVPVPLSMFEDENLRKVKRQRTAREYFWTLTPQLPKFVRTYRPSVKRITYLDSDLYFFNSPLKIINKFLKSNKKMLITEHAYSPQFDQSRTSGKYCVQFITFNFPEAEFLRQEWEDLCMEWCSEIAEPGRYGDQKYLEYFQAQYDSEIHVLQEKHYCQAPWNHTRFTYSDLVFMHFQGLRIVKKNRVEFADYPIPRATFEAIYKPYLLELRKSILYLESEGFELAHQAKSTGIFVKVARQIRGLLWLIKDASRVSSQKF